MSGRSPSDSRHVFDPLPREVVELWLEGKYANGPQRTTDYARLGWALMLRGYYRYQIFGDDDLTTVDYSQLTPLQRGYCIFDLVRGELKCWGIRVMTSREWRAVSLVPHPLLWKSTTCDVKTDASGDSAYLDCMYRMVVPRLIPLADDASQKRWDPFNRDSAPLRQGITDREKEASTAVEYLRGFFDRDWKTHKESVRGPSKPPDKFSPKAIGILRKIVNEVDDKLWGPDCTYDSAVTFRDAAAHAASNQVDGIAKTISNTQDLNADAREDAMVAYAASRFDCADSKYTSISSWRFYMPTSKECS